MQLFELQGMLTATSSVPAERGRERESRSGHREVESHSLWVSTVTRRLSLVCCGCLVWAFVILVVSVAGSRGQGCVCNNVDAAVGVVVAAAQVLLSIEKVEDRLHWQ